MKMSEQLESKEIYILGAPACPGIVIGKTSLYKRERPSISDARISDDQLQAHVDKFDQTLRTAEKELRELLDNTDEKETENLIQMQITILQDPDLYERVEQEILINHKPADAAVQSIFENYLQVIQKKHGKIFLNQSVDISDIRDRLLQIMHNKKDEIEEGAILVARELSPREVISFSNRNLKGIITDRGGATSHAAIIARSMSIPTVVGLKKATNVIKSNDTVVLDGRNGEVVVHPKEKTCKKYKNLIKQQSKREANFEVICRKPNKTADGREFTLLANVEFAEELNIANKYKAEGVGLLRTESIYLSREDFKNIDQQVKFYSSILEVTKPHSVTIRLFDVGGDKFFDNDKEEQNPFLGWRGIRMLLDQPQLLENQLRAILQTAAQFKGRVRILVPMVSTLKEVKQLNEVINRIQQKLLEEGITIDEEVPVGLMVEVPSVAMQAQAFAAHSDFLSIGTNDLTQYVLAVDRGNERISTLYDQRHPAVWRFIQKAAEGAAKQNAPISICGKLASDPIAACCLMGMGINTLSMNSVILPSVKQILRSRSYTDMQKLAKKVLQSDTLDDIDNIFSNWEKQSK